MEPEVSRPKSGTTSDIDILFRIEKFMASISDLQELLEVIIAESRDATDADAGSLLLYDEATDELYFDVALGESGETTAQKNLKRIRLKVGQGVAGTVAQTLTPLNIRDAHSDSRWFSKADDQSGFVTTSLLAVPIAQRGQLIGVLEVLNKRSPGGFSDHDEKVLAVIATQAALVLENAKLYAENMRQARLSALGEGIAGAAHCIKNILNSIDGGSFIVQRALQKEDLSRASKGWEILSRNMGLMRELVLDMLTYSKQRKPENEEVDLKELCKAIVDSMGETAVAKQVTLTADLCDEIRQVTLDPNGIRRCLLNLVGNAMDATEPGSGVVTLSTRPAQQAGYLEISVQDNGCGMSKETQKQLFQPFFSTKGSKGTGLGLSVSHKIVAEQDGEFVVNSELGAGTEFVIRLPWRASA